MSTDSSPTTAPLEVMVEFLYALQDLVGEMDRMLPVLRGSALLSHWFGERARPAGDIDLEWFMLPGWTPDRFASPIDNARALCLFAADSHSYGEEPILFDDNLPIPSGGINLWDYDTPGIRCYTGWTWSARGLSGQLQIDIAQPARYDLQSLPTQNLQLPRASGGMAHVRAYSLEMLLAAKLSWIVRHVLCKPVMDGSDRLAFFGEPKDLFDAHLIVTQARLSSEVFHQAMLAVALEDNVDWNHLEVFLDQSPDRITRDSFINWSGFEEQYGNLTTVEPAEMLTSLIHNCGQLWSDYRQHVPFFRAIAAGPADEANLLIYADWLEEREDWRGDFLRLFCSYHFHANASALAGLKAVAHKLPLTWLSHALGGLERAKYLR